MNRKPRFSRRWKVAASLFAILLVCVTVFAIASRSPFPFVAKYNGVFRESNWLGANRKGRVRCYSFRAPYRDVLKALKEDLAGQGWAVSYEDPALAVFTRRTDGLPEEAVLSASLSDDWTTRGENAMTTCMAWLPYQPSWFHDQVTALTDKLGWTRKGSATLVEPYRELITCFPSVHMERGKPVLELLWRNMSSAPATVNLEALDLANYESPDKLPMSFAILARSSVSKRFLYPVMGTHVPTQEEVNILYGYSSGSADNSFGEYKTQSQPQVNVDVEKGAHVVNVRNDEEERAYEIRGLLIEIDGRKVKSIPGVARLNAASTLRIPVRIPEEATPSMRFEYRLLPNKTWRTFEMDEE